MKIVLPHEISDGRVDTLLRLFQLVSTTPAIVIDFRRVVSILPAGHAIFTALIDKIVESKCHVRFESMSSGISKISSVKHLLEVGGMQSLLKPEKLRVSEKNVLVRVIENSISPDFLNEIEEVFVKKISEAKRWYMRLILNELMQNAYDHSTAERYYAYAGIHENEVHFGVCDLGVTIPAKLEQKYQADNDIEFLLKSLEYGVGTRRTRPGGLGLHHVFEILKSQEGQLVIISRYAQIRKYFKRRKTQKGMLKTPLRGTWCFARMPLEIS